MYTRQTECRVCFGELETVFEVGNLHPTAWLRDDELAPKPAPLTLVRCRSCGLVQLGHTVELDELYRSYNYRSGINSSMVKALRDVVECALDYVELHNGDVVVDIGANDGTLLSFYPGFVKTVGYEPSNIIHDADFDPDIVINDYFSAKAYPFEREATVVTSIAMFYDLPNPRQFVRDVAETLADDGVWIIQVGDLKSTFETNAVDAICHEHLEYYRSEDIVNLVESEGMHVFRIEHNDVNGGSLRFYVDWGMHEEDESVERFLKEEDDYYHSPEGTIEAFAERLERSRLQLMNWLASQFHENRTVLGLGASTKGNTLLQYFGITPHLLQAIGDLNEEKFGKFTVGTRVPVISEKEALARKPDYLLLLIWQYLPFFLEKMKAYLLDGGKLVVPLPEPRIYYADPFGDIVYETIELEGVGGD